MESNSTKILGFVSLAVGIFFIFTGFFVTPGFVASHFSSTGTLAEKAIQAVQVLRFLAVCTGILAAVLAANLIYPSRANRLLDFVSRLGGRFQTRAFYLPFCFACFLVAFIFGLLITQSGPGVSPDSTNYIATGENLYQGNGFRGISGFVFIHYPLYPLSIAGFMHLGFDAEQAARVIPILCFALLVFPLFFLGKTTNNVFAGYVACLICLVFTPLLYVTSYAWIDMPCTFFCVSAILFLTKFAQSDEAKTKTLCVTAFFTALALLMSFAAAALVFVAVVIIVVENRTRLKRMVSQALLFGSISCSLPILWVLRVFVLTGYLTAGGFDPSAEVQPIPTGAPTMAMWIAQSVPNAFMNPLVELCRLSGLPVCGYTGLVIMAACFVLILVSVTVYSTQRNVLLQYLRRNHVAILYIFLCPLMLIMLAALRPISCDPRYLSSVYPFATLVVVSFVFYAYRQITMRSLRPTLFSAITILCVMLFAFQAIGSLAFYQTAKHGQSYNSAYWKNSQAIAWVANNVPDNATVYSDRGDAVEFRLKRPTRYLPFSDEKRTRHGFLEIDEFIERLRSEEDSFIICFKDRRRSYLLSNSEIAELNDKHHVLVVVADFPEATIWRVRR